MNINFHSPFKFNLEVIEIDDYTGSFKTSIEIEIEQFNQLITYKNNLWIKYGTWENFLKSLNHAMTANCPLCDISEKFIFYFKYIDNIPFLEWKFQNKTVEGNIFHGNFTFKIDNDTLGNIHKVFLDFPIWWRQGLA